jgi:biopolymer transport protein ExbD
VRRRRAWRAGEEDDRDFGLQIAPLLDLLFVMLLFFMITAGETRQVRELGLKLPAPAGGEAASVPAAPLRIDIDAAGQVFWNQAPVDAPRDGALPSLRERLRAAEAAAGNGGTEPLVVVTPHAQTRHERVIAVLSACAAAQVHRLAFGAPAE